MQRNGERHIGEMKKKTMHGVGMQFCLNGNVRLGSWLKGKIVDRGVEWSADRKTAWEDPHGVGGCGMKKEITLSEAAGIAMVHGLEVPPARVMVRPRTHRIRTRRRSRART